MKLRGQRMVIWPSSVSQPAGFLDVFLFVNKVGWWCQEQPCSYHSESITSSLLGKAEHNWVRHELESCVTLHDFDIWCGVRSSSSTFCQSQSVVAEQELTAHIIIKQHMLFPLEPDIWHLALVGQMIMVQYHIPPTPMHWCLVFVWGYQTHCHLYIYTMVTDFVCCDRCFSTTALALACWWGENKNPWFALVPKNQFCDTLSIFSCVFHCRPLSGHRRKEVMKIWVWVIPGSSLITEEWLRYVCCTMTTTLSLSLGMMTAEL